ncbi:MAG: LacI family transcriptional regulator [Paenibacillus sp.]|jgi:LacI family transcriptional regulator|nr:LacI family transcriptional regulator [Paenibacillus sp.]
MSRKKSVTLHDLSELLGLSVRTISKALRGLPGMSETTRANIVKAAARHGYRTKDQERSLTVERIPIIPHLQRHFRLVVPQPAVTSGLLFMILEGLQQKLREYGHSIEPLFMPANLKEGRSFELWTEQQHVHYLDGIFIPPIPSSYEKLLLDLPIPRILLNFPPPSADVDSIAWDVGTAVHKSVHYLLAKGHRKILYIGNQTEHRGFRLRWQCFVEAMNGAGLDVRAEDHVTSLVRLREVWIAEFTEKLERMQPTALLYGLGNNVAWVYHACSSIGKRIPHDYSLISLEHDVLDDLPDLTRPFLPIREAGVRGAERMLWRLANPGQPFEHILLQGGFFKGKTVNSLNGL